MRFRNFVIPLLVSTAVTSTPAQSPVAEARFRTGRYQYSDSGRHDVASLAEIRERWSSPLPASPAESRCSMHDFRGGPTRWWGRHVDPVDGRQFRRRTGAAGARRHALRRRTAQWRRVRHANRPRSHPGRCCQRSDNRPHKGGGRRARPFASPGDPDAFNPGHGFMNASLASFPSGHTSAAFATATVLSRELNAAHPGTRRLVTRCCSVQRRSSGSHVSTNVNIGRVNVVAGAALGTITGYEVVAHAHGDGHRSIGIYSHTCRLRRARTAWRFSGHASDGTAGALVQMKATRSARLLSCSHRSSRQRWSGKTPRHLIRRSAHPGPVTWCDAIRRQATRTRVQRRSMRSWTFRPR